MNPQVRCAWHFKNFGFVLVIKEGDATRPSDTACQQCYDKLIDELAARKQQEAA